MEKLNIAEILKDCPSGMEFDCTMYNKVTLLNIDDRKDIIFPIKVFREDGNTIALTKYGQYTDADFAKCIIFPKGKTTWDGFIPPCLFNDGDILTYMFYNKPTIYIYRKNGGYNTSYYAAYSSENKKFYNIQAGALSGNRNDLRFATEEEKQKLFDAIEENGYKWNPETKTLEDLLKPKFKVGDIIVKKNIPTECWYVQGVNTNCNSDYFYYIVAKSKIANLYFKDQEEWELAPVPKFKVGNRIRNNKVDLGNIYTIIEVRESSYVVNKNNEHNNYDIDFVLQDDWELTPNKFDITTLKPFDKVLVRQCDTECWKPALWGRRTVNKNFPFITSFGATSQAIPFKNNEWLVGTNDDCNDYYKTW